VLHRIDAFRSVTVAEPHQSADEASDQSLASSSMVMPKSSSNPGSTPSAGVSPGSRIGHLFEPPSPSTSKLATDVTDDADSDSSSVSLISVPSSDDYESEWQDARSQGENLEYVVLYDSNGSDSDE
jgi:next to BRCA1 gene 1 protein